MCPSPALALTSPVPVLCSLWVGSLQEDSNVELYFVWPVLFRFLRFFNAYAMPVEAKNMRWSGTVVRVSC